MDSQWTVQLLSTGRIWGKGKDWVRDKLVPIPRGEWWREPGLRKQSSSQLDSENKADIKVGNEAKPAQFP